MNHRPKIRPLAAALKPVGSSARADTTVRKAPTEASPASRKRRLPVFGALLPLGAALAGMSLAPDTAHAQSAEERGNGGDVTLPAVNVKDVRDRESTGYQGGTTSIGKIPQLPRDIPQSLTIVPAQLMHDRNSDSFREALRNVSGLTFGAGEGGRNGDVIQLRGFPVSTSDLYLDGIRDVAQYNREVFNIEQIDVLRGSASMLFGRGSTGGIINQASKQPFLVDRTSLNATYGSFDYKRVTADLNKVIGENAAFRLNAMDTDTDTFRDPAHYARWGVAPSVRWGIGTRDEFSLSYYHLKERNIPDYGVPYYQGRPIDIPVTRYFGMANADYEKYETGIATGSWIHRFGGGTELKAVLRKGSYKRDLMPSAMGLNVAVTGGVLTDNSRITRNNPWRAGQDDNLTGQADLTFKWNTGGIRHQTLVGAELAREESWIQRYSHAAGVTVPFTTIGSPDWYPVLPANFFARTVNSDVRFKAGTLALYAQDIMALTDHWKLVLGARWDQLAADYERTAPLGPLERTDRVWSYRSGLLYQPTDEVSYYVSYGTSFNPSAEAYSLDVRGTNTPPETNRNVEAGAKWELFDGNLSLRTAIFRSEKYNERNTDPLVSDQFLLSGKRHTDGIELEAAGRINRDWEVFAGVMRMRSVIDAASGATAGNVGKIPMYTPPYTMNFWTTYKLGGGWKIGGGFEAVGLRYGQDADTTAAPSYIRWDGLIAYEQRRYDIRLNAFNLFDKRYYQGVYQGFTMPGTPRAFQLTLELKF